MKKCALCGRKFLFGSLDAKGYCSVCHDWNVRNEEQCRQKEQYESEQRQKMRSWINSLPSFEIVISDEPYKRQRGYEAFDFSNITPKGSYDGDVVVFDTETTGLSPSKDRIIEIGAIRYFNGEPVEKFHSYVNPERHIPEEVTKINHITDDMVVGAPTIGQILPSFDEFIGKSMLVAHNLEFDLKFIFYSGSRVLETKRKYIDTLDQAHRLIKKDEIYDYKLATLAEYYKHYIADAHSALSDAFATGWLFYHLVLEKQGTVHFVKNPSLPSKDDGNSLFNLMGVQK